MTFRPDLTGYRVLVLEDDYFLATEMAGALETAGAVVMGPCASEEDARRQLEQRRPDAAVIDIHLPTGPSFTLARLLKEHAIPFIFITGYDPTVIGRDFRGVDCLLKPADLPRVVHAVSGLVSNTR